MCDSPLTLPVFLSLLLQSSLFEESVDGDELTQVNTVKSETAVVGSPFKRRYRPPHHRRLRHRHSMITPPSRMFSLSSSSTAPLLLPRHCPANAAPASAPPSHVHDPDTNTAIAAIANRLVSLSLCLPLPPLPSFPHAPPLLPPIRATVSMCCLVSVSSLRAQNTACPLVIFAGKQPLRKKSHYLPGNHHASHFLK